MIFYLEVIGVWLVGNAVGNAVVGVAQGVLAFWRDRHPRT